MAEREINFAMQHKRVFMNWLDISLSRNMLCWPQVEINKQDETQVSAVAQNTAEAFLLESATAKSEKHLETFLQYKSGNKCSFCYFV